MDEEITQMESLHYYNEDRKCLETLEYIGSLPILLTDSQLSRFDKYSKLHTRAWRSKALCTRTNTCKRIGDTLHFWIVIENDNKRKLVEEWQEEVKSFLE